MNGVGAPEFDAYAAGYDAAVNESIAFSGLKVDFFTRVKAAYIHDILVGTFAVPLDLDVLDIGCGVGNYHPHLIGKIGSLTGVDVSGDCLVEAAARNPHARYQGYDGTCLPYADASFDVAYTICVMHHVAPSAWQRFAHEMRRVLRPGGLALVFEHNPWNPLTRRAVSTCVFDKDAVLLRAGQVEALLASAGLREIESRYILSIPAANRALRRLDGLFAHLPFGAQYLTKARAS